MTTLDGKHQASIAAFFVTMSEALKAGRAKDLVELYHVPTVFVNEGEKHICANKGEIEAFLDRFFTFAAARNTQDFSYSIMQAIKLSESLFFVQICWTWKNAQGEVVIKRMTSYTLQEVQPDVFDIVVSVADDSSLKAFELSA